MIYRHIIAEEVCFRCRSIPETSVHELWHLSKSLGAIRFSYAIPSTQASRYIELGVCDVGYSFRGIVIPFCYYGWVL